MATGDKEAAVIECVNAALAARGYPPPYDRTLTMNGGFHYQFETIIAFHRRVKGCLATKGYAYGYSESQQYMNKTLAMTLRQIYAQIAVLTGTHFSAMPTGGVAMGANFAAASRKVPAAAARKRAANKGTAKTGARTTRKTP